MEWTHLAGIKTLNMHLNTGIYFTLPHTRVWINEQYESNFLELLYESYVVLYHLAETYNVELCIENTGNFYIPYIRKALDQLSIFDNFYLTWDVGHDAKAGFEEKPVFNHFKNRIKHMHLHDYNGKLDQQALYSGIVPINNSLDFAREHDCSVVIEVKTSESLTESVARLKNSFK
ncbi:Xylose isomerase-like TIM barrel [Paenibacillus sp. 1_12]|uniref:sugar phosphate isomerase/epimerase family protein n=1 Tax=Paenibacillus sp. 1_12 TaxID=1566278 RepID=UPI0008E84C07|nr:TIM barrel protein [Paenibacillus sp. 1_12]SFK83123.1 Xylose isomerase-like TIM barrel [Paenibacillus sp. 1_12]